MEKVSSGRGTAEARGSPPVVAVCASAGGLDPLKTLLRAVPADSGAAWVVVVHLSPDHPSRLSELLQSEIDLPVRQVAETTPLEVDRVYVIPPGSRLEIADRHLRLDGAGDTAAGGIIDHFLRTLARSHDGDAVAVILSGAGTDGALGVKAVRERGGLVVVQDPRQAEYEAMPRSAIATGGVDLVLPVERIPSEVLSCLRTRPQVVVPDTAEEAADEEQQPGLLERVLAQVHTRTGRDFRRYRRSVLLRRVARRMQLRRVEALVRYYDVLREEPDEVDALVAELLFPPKGFFRDAELFETLERRVIPQVFDGKTPRDEVRVWSVGCGTGEEAYSLAILLLEEAARRRDGSPRIQVFASDLHEGSLRVAREGFYRREGAADVSEERRRHFFAEEPGGYRIRDSVREVVLFARHDVLADPPYSRLDLVACRNLLSHLQPDLQQEVAGRFHYALRGEGFLVLARAELLEWGGLFRPLDVEPAVLRRCEVTTSELRLPPPGDSARRPQAVVPRSRTPGALHEWMVERYAPPSVLVGPNDCVVHISANAGRYLRFGGGPLSSRMERLVRPELMIELRAALHESRERGGPWTSRPIPVDIEGTVRSVVLHVLPALESEGGETGSVLVFFEERHLGGGGQAGGEHPEAADVDLAIHVQALELELARLRERLLHLTEDQESTGQELRTANEELQSTNEELRSTLRELEASREELESANEELQVLADENQRSAEELQGLSTDLERLLVATDIGTLFLDPKLRIVRFTPRIVRLFHARPGDLGRPLSELKHRLDYKDLMEDVRGVLGSGHPVEREVRDDQGRWYIARVLPHRGSGARVDGVVLVFIDITTRKRMEQAEEESRVKSQFLSTMSHELRTPLTAVIGLSDLMETKVLGPMNERQRQTLSRIKQAAWHLVRIIEEVLTYSRSEAGKEKVALGVVDVAGVARDVVSMIQPTAERYAVVLRLEGDGEPRPLQTDAGKLTQIATNLVGNAVKFATAAVSVTVAEVDAAVELRVRDDGPGIPAHRLDDIFEPFTQLATSHARESSGTGLGLTIARRQARLLGGEILVESIEGEGSTFTLRLPKQWAPQEGKTG